MEEKRGITQKHTHTHPIVFQNSIFLPPKSIKSASEIIDCMSPRYGQNHSGHSVQLETSDLRHFKAKLGSVILIKGVTLKKLALGVSYPSDTTGPS